MSNGPRVLFGLSRRVRRMVTGAAAVVLAAAGLVVVLAPPAAATLAEWLDPTYAGTGVATIPGEIQDMFMMNQSPPDASGRFYVVSEEIDGDFSNDRNWLRRVLSDGTIDPTFGPVPLNQTGINYWVNKLYVDNPVGTVTVLSTGPAGVKLTRYLTTGLPDPTFGTGGSLVLLPGASARTDASAPRPGGGYAVVTGTSQFIGGQTVEHEYLIGVTAAGQLDAGWGVAGLAELAHGDDYRYPQLLNRSGGYVLAATPDYGSGRDARLIAYTDAGAIDTSWAATAAEPGVFPLSPFSGVNVDGSSVIVFGSAGDPELSYVQRLTAGGEPDPTFAGDGKAEIALPGYSVGGVTPHGGGYYLTGSSTVGGFQAGASIVKVLGSGGVDLSFGVNGVAEAPLGECGQLGQLFFTASHILASGQQGCYTTERGALVRFTTGGNPDLSYGDGGVVILDRIGDLSLSADYIFVAFMQSDGRLVMLAVGSTPGGPEATTLIFRTAAADPTALPGSFVSLSPSRILDTRSANGVPTTTPVPGQGSVELQVTGRGGVPVSGVGAVVLNVTVTQPSWDGYVTAYPTGQTRPTVSNLNFAAGQTIPNLVTVKLGTDGKVTLFDGQIGGKTVHVIADVAGYYLSGTATAKGTFVPITPERVLDTRNGTGGYNAPLGSAQEARLFFGPPPCCAGETLTDQIPYWWVSAVVMNVTVTQPTWDGTLVAYPSGTTPPLASNLNFTPGTTIPNLVIAKLGVDRSMRVRNNAVQGTVHVIVDISGYFNS
jgi:hypothetical protein